MISFVLSDFFECNTINSYFTYLLRNKDFIFKYPIQISEASGNFPYNYWDGTHCNMLGDGVSSTTITQFINASALPLRLNCNNLYLEEKDFTDSFNSIILNNGQNRNDSIELCNFNLLSYLQEHYSNFNFILSQYAHYMSELTPTLINQIIEFDKFSLIQLPDIFSKNIEFIKQIENTSKIEVNIGTICPITCEYFETCLIKQHKAQYDYNRFSSHGACDKTQNIIYTSSLLELIEFYAPLGITHFKIPSLINSFSNIEILNFYIKFFIKEEYQYEVLTQYMKDYGKDVFNDQFHYSRVI